jgi:hypothetical protein
MCTHDLKGQPQCRAPVASIVPAGTLTLTSYPTTTTTSYPTSTTSPSSTTYPTPLPIPSPPAGSKNTFVPANDPRIVYSGDRWEDVESSCEADETARRCVGGGHYLNFTFEGNKKSKSSPLLFTLCNRLRSIPICPTRPHCRTLHCLLPERLPNSRRVHSE